MLLPNENEANAIFAAGGLPGLTVFVHDDGPVVWYVLAGYKPVLRVGFMRDFPERENRWFVSWFWGETGVPDLQTAVAQIKAAIQTDYDEAARALGLPESPK